MDLECRILHEPRVDSWHGALGLGGGELFQPEPAAGGSSAPFSQWQVSPHRRHRISAERGRDDDAFVRALLPSTHLHKWALWIITVGFGLLTLISAVRVVLQGGKETRGRTSHLLASMCLLLFAVTFSHFGAGHPPRPWSKELQVHHAGIPVALLILLQDYRFVFLDAFVRFL
jgi:hypothetical protein